MVLLILSTFFRSVVGLIDGVFFKYYRKVIEGTDLPAI